MDSRTHTIGAAPSQIPSWPVSMPPQLLFPPDPHPPCPAPPASMPSLSAQTPPLDLLESTDPLLPPWLNWKSSLPLRTRNRTPTAPWSSFSSRVPDLRLQEWAGLLPTPWWAQDQVSAFVPHKPQPRPLPSSPISRTLGHRRQPWWGGGLQLRPLAGVRVITAQPQGLSVLGSHCLLSTLSLPPPSHTDFRLLFISCFYCENYDHRRR